MLGRRRGSVGETWFPPRDAAFGMDAGRGGLVSEDARVRIQKLLVAGDNRMKQGGALEKARESFEQALQVAREAGLEDAVRPLVELRLADLERLARGSPRSAPPGA